jgi:hypothetical protein
MPQVNNTFAEVDWDGNAWSQVRLFQGFSFKRKLAILEEMEDVSRRLLGRAALRRNAIRKPDEIKADQDRPRI